MLSDSLFLERMRIGLQDESQMIWKREPRFKASKPKWKILTLQDCMELWSVDDKGIDCTTKVPMSRRASCLEQTWLLAAWTPLDVSAIRAHSTGVCEHSAGDTPTLRHSRAHSSKSPRQLQYLPRWADGLKRGWLVTSLSARLHLRHLESLRKWLRYREQGHVTDFFH